MNPQNQIQMQIINRVETAIILMNWSIKVADNPAVLEHIDNVIHELMKLATIVKKQQEIGRAHV